MLSETTDGRVAVLGLKAARSGDTDPKHTAESILHTRWRDSGAKSNMQVMQHNPGPAGEFYHLRK